MLSSWGTVSPGACSMTGLPGDAEVLLVSPGPTCSTPLASLCQLVAVGGDDVVVVGIDGCTHDDGSYSEATGDGSYS